MNDNRRPFLGQIVHFYPAQSPDPLVAIVTGITRECEHLIIFPPNAASFTEASVLSKEAAEARGHTGHFWQFPAKT
jgi:hypothetical protein